MVVWAGGAYAAPAHFLFVMPQKMFWQGQIDRSCAREAKPSTIFFRIDHYLLDLMNKLIINTIYSNKRLDNDQ